MLVEGKMVVVLPNMAEPSAEPEPTGSGSGFARRDVWTLLILPLTWGAIVFTVAAIEFLVERDKYEHRGFTDTFDPLAITKILSLPLSAVVDHLVPEGSPPEGLPHLAFRAGLLVVAAVVQGTIAVAGLGLVLWLLRTFVRRRAHRT